MEERRPGEVRKLSVKYPSNSHKTGEEREKESEKKTTKIVSGTVMTKKKSFGKRFIDVFFADGLSKVCPYVIYGILIPAAKATLSESVKGGIDMLLFSEDDRRYRSVNKGPYTSYEKYSSRDKYRDEPNISRGSSVYDVKYVVLNSRREAELVRDRLLDIIEEYDSVSVADFYDAVGVHHTHTDRKYGWKNLRKSSIVPVRGGGYVIEFPRPIYVDD